MRKVIAITGGIGSGKSTVCEIIEKLGYKVVSADQTYKELLNDKAFVKGIHSAVGIDTQSETLLREEVSKIVFNDKEKLKLLNEFTHEKIVKAMFDKTNGFDISFHEVPLLFEGGFEKLYDKVLIVTRPIEDRINSVVSRSGISAQEVKDRIKNQNSYENLNDIEHTLISNDGDLSVLESKIRAVINEVIC